MPKAKFDPSRPLYKYMSRTFVDAFRGRGCFRIGTLHDFRIVEHRLGIGDPSEGTSTVTEHIAEITEKTAQKFPHVISIKKDNPSANPIIRIKDWYSARSEDVENCYGYCVTRSASPEGLARSGYDACVRISDPLEFVKRVTNCLEAQDRARNPQIDSVEYDRRRQTPADAARTRAAFLKDTDFVYQDEVRITWDGLTTPLKPLDDFECRAIIDLLELVDLGTPWVGPVDNPHGPKIDDAALLARTETVVEQVVACLSAEDAKMSAALAERKPSSALQDIAVRSSEARARRMEELSPEIEFLLREYLVRGFRDARIEEDRTTHPSIGFNAANLAAGLQRFGECLELKMMDGSSLRPVRLATATKYRVWVNATLGLFEEDLLKELIVKASSDGRSLRLPPNRTFSRHRWVDLWLNNLQREAFLGLVRKHRLAPSEVIESLMRMHFKTENL